MEKVVTKTEGEKQNEPCGFTLEGKVVYKLRVSNIQMVPALSWFNLNEFSAYGSVKAIHIQ